MLHALALCAVGAEKALANEFRKMDRRILSSSPGRLRFESDIDGLYRALMACRTADRILLEVASARAEDFDALFEMVRAARWADLIPKGRPVTIGKVRSARSKLSSVVTVQSVAHKALADSLCAAWKVRRLPEGPDAAELRIYLEDDHASVYLDLAGEPLFRRGYRTEAGAAPLRETTAAAILLLMGWRRKFPLVDPFCGSGTIAIEAALYAWNAAPGLARRFELSRLAIADRRAEASVREELAAKVNLENEIRISGSDIDERAVRTATANVARALAIATGGAEKAGPGTGSTSPAIPRFRRLDMAEARAEAESGMIVTNPPYGERLGDLAQAEELYRSMAGLAERFRGWQLGVITNHPGFESQFGTAADSVREITNGALRSYLYRYDELGRKRDGHSSRTR